MELKIGIAKTAQYQHLESYETVEIVERPQGKGYSVFLSDGHLNGKADKHVSNTCAKKIMDSIFDGVRDSVALRAASDHIYSQYQGRAHVNVTLLSLDLSTNTIVVSRNNPYPIYYYRNEEIRTWSNDSASLGVSHRVEPTINELSIEPDTIVIAASDGFFQAGDENGYDWDITLHLLSILEENYYPSAQEIANMILNQAILLDANRPNQDMTVVVFQITADATHTFMPIRKVSYDLPFRMDPNQFLDDTDSDRDD